MNKTGIYTFITLAISILLACITLEVVARVYAYQHDRMIREGMKLLWSPLYASIGQPGSHGIHKTDEYEVTLRANREGFRDLDYPDNEVRDIVLLGDSYTWGTGVEESQRFGNILAQQLRVSVANYALCTSGTINELAVYRDFVRSKRKRIVLLMFYPNDVQNNAWWLDDIGIGYSNSENALNAALERKKAEQPSWPDEAKLLLRRWYGSAAWSLLTNSLIKLKTARRAEQAASVKAQNGQMSDIQKDMVAANSNWSAALNEDTGRIKDAWFVTATALRELRNMTREDGAKLMIVYIPYQEQIHPDHWHLRKQTFGLVVPDEALNFSRPGEKLRQISSDLGIEFFDLTTGLQVAAKDDSRPFYYPIDGHLTARGHQVVGQLLAERLRSELPMLVESHI